VQRGERSGGEAGNGGEGLGFVIKREAAVQGGGVDAVHGEGGDVHGQLLVRRGGAAARLRVLERSGRCWPALYRDVASVVGLRWAARSSNGNRTRRGAGCARRSGELKTRPQARGLVRGRSGCLEGERPSCARQVFDEYPPVGARLGEATGKRTRRRVHARMIGDS
jgi:hypothetical protein